MRDQSIIQKALLKFKEVFMNLNQVFYSIAACCLLMTIFAVSEVFAYPGYNYSKGCPTDTNNICITSSTYNVESYEVMIGGGGGGGVGTRARTRTVLSGNNVRRYQTGRIYDFRNRDITRVINIEEVENSLVPIILFNESTVFPAGFSPYSNMLCNQLSNSETLCFYPKS